MRVGNELTVAVRDKRSSHDRYRHFLPEALGLVWGEDEVALNLGWSWLALDMASDAVTFFGPAYAEVQWMSGGDEGVPLALAAGPFVDPRGFDHADGLTYGVQASATWTTIFLRTSANLDGEVALLGGMVLKFPLIFTRSR